MVACYGLVIGFLVIDQAQLQGLGWETAQGYDDVSFLLIGLHGFTWANELDEQFPLGLERKDVHCTEYCTGFGLALFFVVL